MNATWCRKTLEQAIERYGSPEIVNTKQSSQFTSEEFTEFVIKKNIRLSMDGKGRAIDNIFIERLWRSLKYEHVYLKPAEDGIECYRGLQEYFDFNIIKEDIKVWMIKLQKQCTPKAFK